MIVILYYSYTCSFEYIFKLFKQQNTLVSKKYTHNL